MSQPTHPNCMIGRTNTRTLEDGCLSCGYSRVYCHAVKHNDGQPCCDSCSGH